MVRRTSPEPLRGPAATLLRRLALGVPLIVAPAVPGCSCGYSCGPQTRTERVTAEQASLAAGSDGVLDFDECARLCEEVLPYVGSSWSTDGGRYEGSVTACSTDGPGAATMTCAWYTPCVGGRRPAGLVARVTPGRANTVGRWLASAAHLEAASVPAFLELADELRLHTAPPALARASVRAADDERRHARVVGSLAARWGSSPEPVVRVEAAPRDLTALLLDDVVEGCVHEAFAALVAAHQAEHASEPRVRRAYRSIARDEARHALLSFAIADWAAARVGAQATRGAEDARRGAAADLGARCSEEPAPELALALGLPDATRAVELAALLVA